MHQVRLQSGTTTQARLHRVVKYDEGAPTPPAGYPMPHAPTKEMTSAEIPGEPKVDADQRVTETHYNWSLRQPTETIVDPGEGHLKITSVVVYDEATGLPLKQSQPSNTAGNGAGTTRTIYYGVKTAEDPECKNTPQWANLSCKVLPAAQASGTGRPELPVRKIKSYNALGGPMEVTESPRRRR